VEAQSDISCKEWKKRLTPEATKFLSIWRAGAASTPTRRWYGRQGASSQDTCCPFCGAKAASARHFWADCKHFEDTRDALQLEFGFGSRWWTQQPRVTAKSGWITLGRGGAKRQVAACRLALRIQAVLQEAASRKQWACVKSLRGCSLLAGEQRCANEEATGYHRWLVASALAKAMGRCGRPIACRFETL